MAQGGVASMELVAQNLKAEGSYLARNLSYEGVEHDRIQHDLNEDQRTVYNELAKAWQIVLRQPGVEGLPARMVEMELSGGDKDKTEPAGAHAEMPAD